MPSSREPSNHAASWWAIFAVAAPAALAVLEIFHPHVHDLLAVDLNRWLFIHYAQILLFPLAALAVVTLVRNRRELASSICRAAAFAFAVTYVAYDTAAGVITGILVSAAHRSGTPESWRPALDALWTHPTVGGGVSSLLAVLGAVALSVATVAAAVSLRRAGARWPPVVLLAISGFGISIFKTHAWPGGPLTFGGIAIAAAWLLAGPRAAIGAQSPRAAPEQTATPGA